MPYYTFEFQIDRGPDAWERHATETQQFGPCASEAEAWESLRATRGDDAAESARIVRVD
jgi:hypothetical protein